MQRSESYIQGYQDTKIFYQDWMPKNPKKIIFFTHGQGEHSDCYQRLIDGLQSEDLGFIGWDLRGHGKSEGIRGYVENFNDYLYDFEMLYWHLKKQNQYQNIPFYFLAHSLGGLILLKSVLSQTKFEYSGIILSSPFLGLSVKVPAYKDLAARVFQFVLPKLTLSNELTFEMLSSDPVVLKEYEKDLLRHEKMSSGVYLGALESFKFVLQRAHLLKGPLLLQIPEQDPVVSSSASQLFFEKVKDPNKILKVYKNRKHEIYNDIGREEIFQEIKNFLKTQNR